MATRLIDAIVSYIAESQRYIEESMKKQASPPTPSVSRQEVEEAVETLIKYGSIAPSEKEIIIDAFLHKPMAAIDMLTKVCSKLKPTTIGFPSERIAASKLDPIVEFCMK